MIIVFFSSRRRHTSWPRDWSSDVCSSDLIQRHRMIYLVSFTKRDFLVHAINRAGTGVNQVLYLVVTASFKNGHGSHKITVNVGKRVFQGIAHPSLGRQMNYTLELLLGK